MNLTYRHAPELCGHEQEERFYHFASATRGFIKTARDKGVDAARENVRLKRAAKKKEVERERERGALFGGCEGDEGEEMGGLMNGLFCDDE